MNDEERRRIAHHQVIFFRRWVATEEAQRTARQVVAQLVEHLDARPGAACLDPAAVERAIDAAFDERVRVALAGPLARALVATVVDRLAARPERLGDLVGEASAEAWTELAAREDVLEPELVRATFADPAAEAIMREVLLDALRQFNDRVNPFFADWGLPALVAAVPLGKRALEKALGQVRKEYDRRLEPEMARFLERFARHSLERLATSLLDRAGDGEMVALRRHVAGVVLRASVAQLTWPADDPRGVLLVDAATHAVEGLLAHPSVRAEVRDRWRAVWEEVRDIPIGDARRKLGIELPPLDDVVDAAWPAVQSCVANEGLSAIVGDLLARSLEGVDTP